MGAEFRLYHYWRSSSSWRVRWALQLKGIECEFVPINLLSDETESEAHRSRNPFGYVPVLEWIHPTAQQKNPFLTESMAIIEYLDERFPKPSLLPQDIFLRAKTRQLAEMINSGTQPLQNPSVASFHSAEAEEQKRWNRHWITAGFQAYETLVKECSDGFSVGNQVTLADLFLIPQCYNALRNDISLSQFPTIEKIYHRAMSTESCQKASPDQFKPPA
jgi:maleylacetoacetate isomerase